MQRKIVMILVIVAAIAVMFVMCDGPWHVTGGRKHFAAKVKQSEVKVNLASIAESHKNYFAKKKKWGSSFKAIGWEPVGKTIYIYFVTPTDYKGASPAEVGLTLPVDFSKYGAPTPGIDDAAGFTAVAIGNIDDDATLDVWRIDKSKVPYNVLNDVGK